MELWDQRKLIHLAILKTYDFDADDDEEAFRLLHDESCLDVLLQGSGDVDIVDPDALDESRGLDRFEDGALLMVDEQLPQESDALFIAVAAIRGKCRSPWRERRL